MKRGEVWLADLGYAGKVRPVLILSVEPGDADRALVTYVIRTISPGGGKSRLRLQTSIKASPPSPATAGSGIAAIPVCS